ncbi:MAG: pitrilysin family protein [Pseudomonadota bacterium]
MSIQTFFLKNGLKVVLKENHSSPVISFNVLVKVGSAHETDQEAGMSHVIEHMLFKGTPTRPVGAIAKEVEAAGGEINAYTSLDQTVYYINMAARYAERGLAILADAIQNPLFDKQELENEKEVILEEIRREKDNPGRMVTEYLFQTSYQKHPYARPIIGYPKTVKSFEQKDLLNFYKRWYVPKNMALVVVGDFETNTMLKEVEKAFADFQTGQMPIVDKEILVEPPQREIRLMIESMNVQSCYLAIGYHIPELVHNDVPALDLLSHILGGSESSRFEQEIKEKKHLVHHISTYSYTPRDPGLFTVNALLDVKNIRPALIEISKQIEIIKSEPALVSEISRAKINMRSHELYERETVGGEAGKIASFLAAADSHEFESRYYQKLMDVHTDELLEVANRYFTANNCTITLVVPKGSSSAKTKSQIKQIIEGGQQIKKAGKKTIKPIEEFKLKNGLRVIIKEDHTLPLVAVCGAALGGVMFETKANNGISELAVRLLTKGTKNRDAITIAKDIEKIAGYVDGFSGRNTMGLKSKFLSDHLQAGLELFCEVLTKPAFSAKEVNKEKNLQLQAIKDQEDALSAVALLNFLKTLFPKHPYGLRNLGEISSVSSLSPTGIKLYYNNIMRKSGAVISVVGDVSPKEVVELLEQNLTNMAEGKAIQPKVAKSPKPSTITTVEQLKKDKQQAHIVLGFQGTTFNHPDRYVLGVLNNILIGQGGRLFLELRDRLSLAYAVSAVNVEGTDPGYFAVYIGTDPSKIDRAINGIKVELGKILEHVVSENEIERSKQYLIGSHALDSQRLMTMSSWYTLNKLYGLPLQDIENYPQKIMQVTRKKVWEVAKKYIDLNAYVLSVVKPH